jgi:hypothetical protein
MSFISVIVIYLDNGAGNSCISSIFGFFLQCTRVHVFFLQCLIRWIKVGCMADCFLVNTLMVEVIDLISSYEDSDDVLSPPPPTDMK